MAKVNIENVTVLDNPSDFLNPFQFEITFECIENLPQDLEWKLTYVGSAESETFDQILDTVLVGPVPEGRHKFVFQADAPEPSRIPKNEAIGVTVILLSCAYRDKEFIKIGYFVASDYEDTELKENPPEAPLFDKLKRNVIAEQPRVTRITIPWDEAEDALYAKEQQGQVSQAHGDGGGDSESGGGGGAQVSGENYQASTNQEESPAGSGFNPTATGSGLESGSAVDEGRMENTENLSPTKQGPEDQNMTGTEQDGTGPNSNLAAEKVGVSASNPPSVVAEPLANVNGNSHDEVKMQS